MVYGRTHRSFGSALGGRRDGGDDVGTGHSSGSGGEPRDGARPPALGAGQTRVAAGRGERARDGDPPGAGRGPAGGRTGRVRTGATAGSRRVGVGAPLL